uniref:hypothetical protein n=1 Tax=Actinotalea sp. TaxID=1872145 RepID=UPI003568EBAA
VSVDGGPAVTVTGTSTVFSSLTGGQHSVSVVAVNSKGEVGPASTASGTTLTVPQAPSLQPAVVAANGVITFSWLPGGTGGSVILDYAFTRTTTDALGEVTTVTGTVPVAVPALVVPTLPGDTVKVTITARTAVGTGVGSSQTVTIPLPDPDPGAGSGPGAGG